MVSFFLSPLLPPPPSTPQPPPPTPHPVAVGNLFFTASSVQTGVAGQLGLLGKLEIECCDCELDYRVAYLVAQCVHIEMIKSKGGVGTGETTWPDTGLLMVVAIAIVNAAY